VRLVDSFTACVIHLACIIAYVCIKKERPGLIADFLTKKINIIITTSLMRCLLREGALGIFSFKGGGKILMIGG